MQDVVAAVLQIEILLKRLARPHLLQPPLPDLLGRRARKEAALRCVLDHVAHRDADVDQIFGQAVHVEKARIVENNAVVGIDCAQPVRHLGDRLVEPLELDAQVVFLALALGDVLDQRNPAAVGERTIVHRESASARHLAQQPERLAARHHLGTAALYLLKMLDRKVAALGGMPDQVRHRQADPRDLGRKAIHLEETVVEQDEPLLGIDHRQAVRHARERRLVQRKQFLELTCLRAISPNGS